jgi:hypothetical protein
MCCDKAVRYSDRLHVLMILQTLICNRIIDEGKQEESIHMYAVRSLHQGNISYRNTWPLA